MRELGALIRDTRERRKIRSYDLAFAVEQSPSWLSRLERGDLTHVPAPPVLEGLSRELGLSQREMLESLGYDLRPEGEDLIDQDLSGLIDGLKRIRLTEERILSVQNVIDTAILIDERAARGKGDLPDRR